MFLLSEEEERQNYNCRPSPVMVRELSFIPQQKVNMRDWAGSRRETRRHAGGDGLLFILSWRCQDVYSLVVRPGLLLFSLDLLSYFSIHSHLSSSAARVPAPGRSFSSELHRLASRHIGKKERERERECCTARPCWRVHLRCHLHCHHLGHLGHQSGPSPGW
jgi:hypothetical protein